MPEPKQPQDHKAKGKATEPDEYFTFISQGEPVTCPIATADALGAKFVRENRRRDPLDFTITAFEQLANRATIDAFDKMNRAEYEQFQRDFEKHLGATLGE